ncbi:MAG: DUF2298 domain-containing protein [Acidobacteriota bacterium]
MLEIARWGAVVELLGLAVLPLLRVALGNRRDAALLSRPAGLALVGWGAWALALLPRVPFDRRGLIAAAVLLGILSWLVSRRAAGPRIPLWGREETRGALFFWAPAAVFLLIRACLPEILGQEKFMDLAFLNSLSRNPAMPPPDPWMSGATINYYYWGYLLAAALVRLSAVTTTISYNLLIATFAGYSFAAAACLGFRLSAGRLRAAIWAGIATVFAGDLAGAFDAWKAPFGKGFDYWHASRVIGNGNTINEFPFFTFFQADLHPHLLAFPFFIAAFAAGHRVLERRPSAGPLASKDWSARAAGAWPSVLLAFLAGTARAANNWTLPALAILIVGVSVLRTAPGGGRLPGGADAVRGALRGAFLVLLSLLLWFPYSKSYALPSRGLGQATLRSGLLEFLFFWGLLLLAAAIGMSGGGAPAPTDEAARRRRDLCRALAGAAALAASFATGTPALLVLVPLVLLAGGLAWKALRTDDSESLYAGCLLLLGLAMVAGCEFVYFRDSYGQDLQRMNTVFKFYHQAWPLLAIAAAVLAERAWRFEGRFRKPVRLALGAAIVLALLYPADALLSRLRNHEGRFTLDAFPSLFRRAGGDALAIQWLEKNAKKDAVVLEATGDAYSEYSRIASHTGIPTVLGWANHEGLWRNNDQQVGDRASLVRSFYLGGNEQIALVFLKRYRVTHVVLGDLERRLYPSADRIASYPFLSQELRGPTAVYSVHAGP